MLNEPGAGLALAIIDLVMPGMPGLAVFEAARRRHPGLRVLFATGYSPGTSQFPGLERLPAPVLPKPYGLTELAAAVRGRWRRTRRTGTDRDGQGRTA